MSPNAYYFVYVYAPPSGLCRGWGSPALLQFAEV
jgi:hypothetical protein